MGGQDGAWYEVMVEGLRFGTGALALWGEGNRGQVCGGGSAQSQNRGRVRRTYSVGWMRTIARTWRAPV